MAYEHLQDSYASLLPFSFSLLLNSLEGCRQMGESLGLDSSKALDEMNSLNMAGCTKTPLRLNEILSKEPDMKSAF